MTQIAVTQIAVTQIAVTILDPHNRRSAQLVETRLRTHDVILALVARLQLPKQAIYQLFLVGSENALPADRTLAEIGVLAGAELQLKAVRNVPLAAPSPAIPSPAVLSNVGTPLPRAGSHYQLSPQVAKPAGMSCMGIGLMALGVIIAGSIVLAGMTLIVPGIVGNLADWVDFVRPGGVALGTGDVQVTLRWEGEADLDLHVVDPNGEEIWFANPESGSGGILDVDANGACEGLDAPVENVYWPTGDASPGTYSVLVTYYQTCARTEPTNYAVTITLDGEVVDVINAQISIEGEEHPVTDFAY